ncbi:MAG: LptF/LptG family permease [Archangium sp.]|nr:LptF/LptG family permease [Archangium sp.]
MITWEKSVARLAAGIFIALALALVALFLVIDFGDWLRIYTGKPPGDVAQLYWYRSHLALVQFAPAALVLTGGLTTTLIRRRGEWTALKALGASPWAVLRPVIIVSLAGALALFAFQELVVSRSGPQVDRIMVERFDRWGDFLSVYTPRRWFRAGPWLINVRGEANPAVAPGGSELGDVRLFELDADGRLSRWLEGRALISSGPNRWRLEDATELSLTGAEARPGVPKGTLELEVPLRPEVTRLAVGRPEWLPVSTLVDQVGVLGSLQLPTEAARFAIHQRGTSLLVTALAALITALLALASRNRPSIPLALISGGVLYGTLFVVQMICRSLALNGHLAPPLAAWMPSVLLVIGGAALLRRAWRLA